MALNFISSRQAGSVGKLRLINFALTFALVGMVSLIVSQAQEPAGYYGSMEQDQVNRINAARTTAGVGKLQHIECLNKIAETWAKTMANKGAMEHSTSAWRNNQINANCGGAWIIQGENVSRGFTSSEMIFRAYMSSPGHKENILRSSFKKVGVGVYRDAAGTLWTTQLFASCSSCPSPWSTSAIVAVDPIPYKTWQYGHTVTVPNTDVPKFNIQTQSINNGDAFFVKRQNTASGNVEISRRVANAHTTVTGAHATAVPSSDITKYDAQLQVAENGDLFFIKRKNTPSGFVEVGRLTLASAYKTWAYNKPTVIPVAELVTHDAQLQMAYEGDLFYIKRKSTSDGVVQVHRLTLTSNYKTWSYKRSTSVSNADAIKFNYQVQVMGNSDLFFIKRQNTASGYIEVGRLAISSGLKTWTYVKPTIISLNDFNNSCGQINAAQDGDLLYIKCHSSGSMLAGRLKSMY